MIPNEHIHHHGGSPNGLLNGITPSTDSKGEAHNALMDVFGKSSKKMGGLHRWGVPKIGGTPKRLVFLRGKSY